MTEMMLALYKGEKLIGYEWQLTLEKAIKINSDYAKWFEGQVEITDMVKLYSRNLYVWTIFELPNYDSFRLGIEINSEWLFSDDKVVIISGMLKGVFGTLHYAESWFTWEVQLPNAPHPLGDFYNPHTDKWLIEKKEE